MFELEFIVNENIEIKDFLFNNKFSNKLITFYLHNKHLIKLNNHELNRYNLVKNDTLNITYIDEESNINITDSTHIDRSLGEISLGPDRWRQFHRFLLETASSRVGYAHRF